VRKIGAELLGVQNGILNKTLRGRIDMEMFLKRLNRSLATFTLAVLATLLFAHLTTSPTAMADNQADYKVITVKDGGIITGVVRFDSSYPKRKKLRVTKDNEACGTKYYSERFLVNASNKGLKNVLVTVEGISAGKAPQPVTKLEVEQKGCTYIPHFQVAEITDAGVEIKFFNNDGIFHNVHALHEDTTLFNLPQFGDQPELIQRINISGIIRIKCDVHSWMGASVILLKNEPYFAVTDSTGQFTITDIPAGTYTLKGWHEGLGNMNKEIIVSANETTETEFVIKPKKKKKKK